MIIFAIYSLRSWKKATLTNFCFICCSNGNSRHQPNNNKKRAITVAILVLHQDLKQTISLYFTSTNNICLLLCLQVLFQLYLLCMLNYRFHCSRFISFSSAHALFIMFHFYSFSSNFISFILSTKVLLIYIYLVWLHWYYMVIPSYCQFHFSDNPVSGY